MKRLPAPLVPRPEGDDRIYVTAALPDDMADRLEHIIDTAQRTHPDADMQGLVDMVMCAGIEAVERGPADAPVIGATGAALAAACAQRDTIPSAPAIPQWQPIETAPNEGWFLVHSEKGWIGVACRSDPDHAPDEGWFEDEHTEFIDPAWLTHWMPLPAAPSNEEKEKAK